jgi:hypothetical protein
MVAALATAVRLSMLSAAAVALDFVTMGTVRLVPAAAARRSMLSVLGAAAASLTMGSVAMPLVGAPRMMLLATMLSMHLVLRRPQHLRRGRHSEKVAVMHSALRYRTRSLHQATRAMMTTTMMMLVNLLPLMVSTRTTTMEWPP